MVLKHGPFRQRHAARDDLAHRNNRKPTQSHTPGYILPPTSILHRRHAFLQVRMNYASSRAEPNAHPRCHLGYRSPPANYLPSRSHLHVLPLVPLQPIRS